MSVTERLNALDSRVDVDLDGSLGEVRRRAGRRRRLRIGVASCAAAVLVVVGAGVTLLVVDGEDSARVDTADTETNGDLDALAQRLLQDDDVLAVTPDLAPRTGYLTGEPYGEIPVDDWKDHDGFERNALAGVERHWSERGILAPDGEPRMVTSSVFEYPSDAEAATAADEVLALLPPTASDVGDTSIRAKLTSFDGGNSEGRAVATTGPLLLIVRVEFLGQGDPLVVEELAHALTR